MNWEVKYLQQKGVVCVKTAGVLDDVKQNQMMIADGLAEAAKHNATKFLLDDRDLTLGIKTLELYYLPTEFEGLGVNRNYRVAIVLSESSKDEYWEFYENRAVNLGYTHHLFTEPEAALDWLTEPRR